MAADDIDVQEITVRFTVSPTHPYPSGGPIEREMSLTEFLDRYGDRFHWYRHGDWLKRCANLPRG